MADETERRKRLTFEQAEGEEPLPTQLRLKEVSSELRAKLWHVFNESLVHSTLDRGVYDGDVHMVGHWLSILYDKHVNRDHKMADEFISSAEFQIKQVKQIFVKGNYIDLFGFVQWVLRHPEKPYELDRKVAWALEASRAAYTLIDGDTIVPIGSEAEASTIEQAFADLKRTEFNGARAHLSAAGSSLTSGQYADSIRESIHAVELVARVLDPAAKTLSPALVQLEKKIKLHPALRNGFSNLYGFTNDEKGIRHPLLDEPVSVADETDALYMFGSCAAFVSYLINKARQSGLLTTKK